MCVSTRPQTGDRRRRWATGDGRQATTTTTMTTTTTTATTTTTTTMALRATGYDYNGYNNDGG